MFDQATLNFYDTEAPTYVASGKDGTNRWLPSFVSLLSPGANILELGCGGGIDAEALIKLGFNVEPTDGSAEIAVMAEERLKRKVKVMRFDELNATETYDAVLANASLLHVPRKQLPSILKLVFNALKPNGVHFASYKAGGTEGRDSFGRYFNYLDKQQLLKAYAESASWEIISVVEQIGGGFDGKQGPWLAITVRKPAI